MEDHNTFDDLAPAKKDIDWMRMDVPINYEGCAIKLPGEPDNMPIPKAIERLEAQHMDNESEVSIHHTVDAYPLDGAVAFIRAMQEIYGWTQAKPSPGFFKDNPPTMVTIDIGPNGETAQIIWGHFKLPGVSGYVATGTGSGPHGPNFVISGEVKKKHATEVYALARLTEQYVKTTSIYKGKAIRLKVKRNGSVDHDNPPIYLSTSREAQEHLVLNRVTEALVETSLFTPIRHSGNCLRYNIPLKRGILLHGDFGVGKSMTATMTANVCVEHGWTFIVVDRVAALPDALELARRYQPAVVFSEDIDRAVDTNRDEKANDILNIIDGVLHKECQVITVLTTNNIDVVNRAMLRPGRLDAVIEIEAPDADSVRRLLTTYTRGCLHEDANLIEASEILSGSSPAVVREAAERAKLSAIQDMNGSGKLVITDDNLVIAAQSLDEHRKLLERPLDTPPTPGDKIASGIGDVVGAVDLSSLTIEHLTERLAEKIADM